MLDLRRGFARIGYVFLALWEALFIGLMVYALFFRAPLPLDPSRITDDQFYFLMLVLMIGPPLAIFLVWQLLLWLLRGFVRTD
jgi:hypothetical protein